MNKVVSRSANILGLLESVERDGTGSQRVRASEFGIALGLVNAYLNYCIKKGYVKVRKIPARRYVYFLTPKGVAEKSRLTVEKVSDSLNSFRKARHDYSVALEEFLSCGQSRVVLVGISELTEIAMLCAAEQSISPVAVVAPNSGRVRFMGIPVVADFASVVGGFDGALIADLCSPAATYESAVRDLGAGRVAVPAILGVSSISVRGQPIDAR